MAAEYQRYPYDVLVMGAGGAGLRAAIAAAGSGVKAQTVMGIWSDWRIL